MGVHVCCVYSCYTLWQDSLAQIFVIFTFMNLFTMCIHSYTGVHTICTCFCIKLKYRYMQFNHWPWMRIDIFVVDLRNIILYLEKTVMAVGLWDTLFTIAIFIPVLLNFFWNYALEMWHQHALIGTIVSQNSVVTDIFCFSAVIAS